MSPHKRKLNSDIERTFESISTLLSTIKPKLNDSTRSWSPVLADLQQIAALAESFAKQRPKLDNSCLHLIDAVDREGVNLWNVSALLRDSSGDESRSIFAALRFAGFRLIEAGLEQRPGIETLIHVLQLASKVGASLSEAAQNDCAASVLASAAKYEEAIRAVDDPQDSHAEAKARAVVLYYSSRMEAAWREGNDGVADYMLRKISENNQSLAFLSPREREILAAKLLDIGKSSLKNGQADGTCNASGVSRDPVKWIQKAFAIAEPLEDVSMPGAKELKRSILRSLARAYFLSSSECPENLSKAETALHELIASIDTSVDKTSAEHQQLRWMRIAVLKRRKAAVPVLLDAFRSLIDHMAFTEGAITDILQELRTFGHLHALVTEVHQHCILQALETKDRSGFNHIDRLLLSLIFHCAKGDDHSTSVHDIETAFTSVRNAGYECSKTSATACLTLLWQFGDRHYHGKRWTQAADWFLLGTDQIFSAMARISNSKCFRKAALCHISQKGYAQASAVIQRCSEDEAATHYVAMLIAVHQGLEHDAMKAVRDMVKAPDFDKKMLLLATRLANELDMKELLLSILEELFNTMQQHQGPETPIEAVGLIRCMIRLDFKILGQQSGSNRSALILSLSKHCATASKLVATFSQGDLSLIAKDISWLWRTAYNCAIQGSSEWGAVEDQVSGLFDIARELLELQCETLMTDVDVEVYAHIINTSFASTAGRVFASRLRSAHDVDNMGPHLTALSEDIGMCRKRILETISKIKSLDEETVERANSFLNILSVFEIETLCRSKTWTRIPGVIEDVLSLDALILSTLEAIADILWVDKDCPIEGELEEPESMKILTALHQSSLQPSSLDHSLLSVEKFSRWLRAICTMLLSRNTATDRTKAMGYVEQAINVLEDHCSESDPEAYPMDERQWLLGTAYNTGIECLHASHLDEARRWFEASTSMCRFVPDGENRAAKISQTYSQLLARYTSEPSRHEDYVGRGSL